MLYCDSFARHKRIKKGNLNRRGIRLASVRELVRESIDLEALLIAWLDR
jgi:hypothetical protein